LRDKGIDKKGRWNGFDGGEEPVFSGVLIGQDMVVSSLQLKQWLVSG
jgi:hypothetical protein